MTGIVQFSSSLRPAQTAWQETRRQARQLAPLPRTDHVPPEAARAIAALLALRGQVIAPILADVRSPRMRRKPAHWTQVDRDYENLRTGMQALFGHLGITTEVSAAA